jgi:UDP-glucose 4-epimerase
MATLVTGGAGFIGANIVKGLADAGHQVVCLDINGPDQLVRDFLGEAYSQVSFVQGDILDTTVLEQLRDNPAIDKIVHAAVFTVNRLDLETQRSKDIVDINIAGTANLLELARICQVQRFLYVSSGAVYGAAQPADQTLNEDDHPVPLNLYGITKYASELLTRRYGELHRLSTASVRLSTPFGPMERVTGHRAVMSVYYQWTGQAVRGETIHVGDLNQGRDYTYVADIASGIRAVLDAPALPHDLYNITAGAWISFKEILAQLRELYPTVQVVAANTQEVQPRFLEPSRGPLSGHRLHQDLGWSPQYDLARGLADYLQWRRDAPFLD